MAGFAELSILGNPFDLYATSTYLHTPVTSYHHLYRPLVNQAVNAFRSHFKTEMSIVNLLNR